MADTVRKSRRDVLYDNGTSSTQRSPWSKMVNMQLTDEEKLQGTYPAAEPKGPDYPYGLRISLTGRELQKLGSKADCQVGDVIDLRCFARVCSVSSGDGEDRVELQITDMAAENEMTEDANG